MVIASNVNSSLGNLMRIHVPQTNAIYMGIIFLCIMECAAVKDPFFFQMVHVMNVPNIHIQIQIIQFASMIHVEELHI